MVKKNMATKFDNTKHSLVSKHSKLSDKEKKELFEEYSIDLLNLPRIRSTDAALSLLGAEEGDVIKIVRASLTAGETKFYRRVV